MQAGTRMLLVMNSLLRNLHLKQGKHEDNSKENDRSGGRPPEMVSYKESLPHDVVDECLGTVQWP